MNRRLYDILKAIALIWLPAAGTLVFAISDIWNLPKGPQIVGTIMAVDAFLGAGLGLTSRNYNQKEKFFDGDLLVNDTDPVKDLYTLDIRTPLEELPGKNEIRLKVVPSGKASAA